MRYAVAGVVLLLGAAAFATPVFAQGGPPAQDVPAQGRLRGDKCADCPAPRRYDSEEVIKKTKTIDRSRTINTQTVVPVGRRLKETNHLIIHQNETRNVGVIRHNHTIIEKEVRYVRRVPVTTVVEVVTHNYRVVERPESITVPVDYRPAWERCHSSRLRRHDSCGVLRVRD